MVRQGVRPRSGTTNDIRYARELECAHVVSGPVADADTRHAGLPGSHATETGETGCSTLRRRGTPRGDSRGWQPVPVKELALAATRRTNRQGVRSSDEGDHDDPIPPDAVPRRLARFSGFWRTMTGRSSPRDRGERSRCSGARSWSDFSQIRHRQEEHSLRSTDFCPFFAEPHWSLIESRDVQRARDGNCDHW